MPEYLTTTVERGVARIELNRPEKRNALKREFIEELKSAVDAVRDDERVRVLVLAAAGPVFCAGMDLEEMQSRAQSAQGAQEWQRDSEVYAELLETLFTLPVPTITRLQGPVLAGGVGMVLATDLVIASDSAFFMLPEPMRGITAAMVTPFLVHRAGASAASYLLLSGERVAADDALKMGLCHDVVPAAQLDERIERLVHNVLSGSPAALRLTKEHLQRCSPTQVLENLQPSIRVSAQARETSDAREGLAAFLEKRKPAWQPDSQSDSQSE